MTKYLSAAETAKIVRKLLKEKFPTIKFGVRSKTYSGGDHVRVTWTDGPTEKQVNKVVGFLSGKGFDGSIDLGYSIHHWMLPDGKIVLANSPGSAGSGGYAAGFTTRKPHPDAIEVSFADHILVSRGYTKPFLERIVQKIAAKFGEEPPTVTESKYGGGAYLAITNYDQQKRYWTLIAETTDVNGKLHCDDHINEDIINK